VDGCLTCLFANTTGCKILSKENDRERRENIRERRKNKNRRAIQKWKVETEKKVMSGKEK
jgi:hypothetical protein